MPAMLFVLRRPQRSGPDGPLRSSCLNTAPVVDSSVGKIGRRGVRLDSCDVKLDPLNGISCVVNLMLRYGRKYIKEVTG